MADNSKHSLTISNKLYNNIKEYCHINDLKINTFVEGLLTRAFNVEKFGATPFSLKPQADDVIEDEPLPKEEALAGTLDDLLKNILQCDAEPEIAAQVPQETAEIADNNLQSASITPMPQEKEEVTPSIVRQEKPHKKVTRLN